VEIIAAAGRFAEPDDSGATYEEQLRRPDLSVGTYSLRAGAVDPQRPHTEDEVYAVTAGRGQFTGGGRTVEVAAGSVLFVPAGEAHRFHDITEDLAVLVFFGPAFRTRAVEA
jgi:mannose-6-phosphate isomerase-like protein (cupin superfamily)